MGSVVSKRTYSLAAFSLAAILFLTIAALYLYNIFRWVNYPDFGTRFRSVTGALLVNEVTENGSKAGIKIGDHILSINGTEIQTFQDLRYNINRNLGEKNTYLIARDGKIHKITITNVPLGYKKAFGRSGLAFFLGLCYFLIGFVISSATHLF